MTTRKRGQKLTKQELDKAKQMYLDYSSPKEIGEKLNISSTTLTKRINDKGGWKEERNLRRAELLANAAAGRTEKLTRMTSDTITTLSRALRDLATRDEPPTINEAKGAAAILETLDKITRLDAGDPTEIIRDDKPTTIVELKKRLAADPFAGELEDAEYEEITEETD